MKNKTCKSFMTVRENNLLENKQNGITLIALVVTIVVLLILAGITINMVFSNNGVINQAQEAGERQKEAQKSDQKAIKDVLGELQKVENGGGTKITTSDMSTYPNTYPYLPSNSFSVVPGCNTLSNGLVITDKLENGVSTGNEYVWIEVPKNATTVYKTAGIGITDYEAIPTGKTKTGYELIRDDLIEYSKAYKSNTNYQDYWYYRSASSTTYSKDPLTGTEYKNNGALLEGESMTSYLTDNDGTKTCGLNYEEYQEYYQAMLKSVYENGGFWIGRYEAGMDENSGYKGTGTTNYGFRTETNSKNGSTYIPLSNTENLKIYSQAHKYPINNIRCSDAQAIASQIAPGGYHSSLMFGVQWDLVLAHLAAKGETNLTSNSQTWGNYQNSTYTISDTNAKYANNNSGASYAAAPTTAKTTSNKWLLTTGTQLNSTSGQTTTSFAKKNIYDLAGNVYEWTLERTSNSDYPCAYRGGSCNGHGSSNPASYRGNAYPTSAYYSVGFRPTLY